MPRPSKPSDLLIPPRSAPNGTSASTISTPSTLHGVDMSAFESDFSKDFAASLTSLPPLPHSPPASPGLSGDSIRNVSSFKSRLSPEQENKKDVHLGKDGGDDLRPGTSSMSKIYHLRKNPGSTPELSLVGGADSSHKSTNEGSYSVSDSQSQTASQLPEDSHSVKRKDKTFRNPLTRNKSLRRDSHSKSRPTVQDIIAAPPQTASAEVDWPGAEARSRGRSHDRRGKSAERVPANDSDDNASTTMFRNHKARDGREGRDEREARDTKEGKSGFIAGSKNVMSKAKSGGGMFLSRLGKIGRSGSSSTEKEVSDYDYQLKIINLPLVEQTRLTRISKTLSGCRDKTEYWMPSLPWRAIDYLNTKCEMEGLYRIPGSGPHVKTWQRRFDTELDVDLLSTEVLDPNEIASMLKAWLRELPTEIMPSSAQQALAVELEKEDPDYRNVGQPVSQLLRNALSKLPPFNYYLLFAVTCHLSLLLANKDRNRMDLNNISVCVGPCLGLERWLFNYLVADWRNCWQGCHTEKEALDMEKNIEEGPEHEQSPAVHGHANGKGSWPTPANSDTYEHAVVDDRAVSSGSSKPTSSNGDLRAAHTDLADAMHKMNVSKSKTFAPMGSKMYSNKNGSNARLGVEQEVRRPSTADNRRAPGMGLQPSSDNITPQVVTTRLHSRSHSDLPPTPGHPGTDADFMFPIQRPSP